MQRFCTSDSPPATGSGGGGTAGPAASAAAPAASAAPAAPASTPDAVAADMCAVFVHVAGLSGG